MAFSWGNPINWIRSRRHLTAFIWDTTDKKREQWAQRQAERHGLRDFSLRRDLPEEFSFTVLGDTGEGDSSQLVVVDKFLAEGADTAFTIIASDVIYPAGRSHEYREKFYVPYRGYGQDIYAIPGNHDWYDELVGFMIHFCDNTNYYKGDQKTVDPMKLDEMRRIRRNQYYQPNMYFYIDTRHVRIVCIDTGIRGRIDGKQREWLERVSAAQEPKPKILITGKPIFVNGEFDDSLRDVNDIVNRFNYRLVIGGDTHNFQRYRIPVNSSGQQRIVWHLVNGGGGAYTSRTHNIPQARDMRFPPELGIQFQHEPEDFTCFPSREDSRKFYPTLLQILPDALVDRDKPPYHKSFVKVKVRSSGLLLQVFTIEDFDLSTLQSGPSYEWEIPYN